MRKLIALSAVACLAAASAASAGSHPQEREGFWAGIGLGVGSAEVTCDDCGPSSRETSAVLSIRLGGTLNERLLLGIESNTWLKEQDGVTVTLANVAATLTLYPQPASGFFIKGGVGFSAVINEFREGSTTVTLDPGYGLGLIAGAGYDFRVKKNLSITPAVNFWYGKLGNVPHDGEPFFTNWKQNVVDFTVGVTFH